MCMLYVYQAAATDTVQAVSLVPVIPAATIAVQVKLRSTMHPGKIKLLHDPVHVHRFNSLILEFLMWSGRT